MTKRIRKIRDKEAVGTKALVLHKRLGGKIRIRSAVAIRGREMLSLMYTPGVGEVASYVAKYPSAARAHTIQGRMVAVISDGSAVLGLGNIGASGALPVMEGKCALFKTFAGVDAFPLVLDTQDPDEIVETVVRVAPAFGGINLEDIAAPKCFDIEKRLQERLDIPVFHDDQHGTAIVVLAALINAIRVSGKRLDDPARRIVVSGAGAAGVATVSLLKKFAPEASILAVDSAGIIGRARADLNAIKRDLVEKGVIVAGESGSLARALEGADALIGVSRPGIVTAAMIRSMAPRSIVFAMANPVPEIMPDEARSAGAAVVGTGRSDLPNQINNALVFPGVFRGALDRRVRRITDDMKMRAAQNLAALVKKPTARKVIPGPFDEGVAAAVARAIR